MHAQCAIKIDDICLPLRNEVNLLNYTHIESWVKFSEKLYKYGGSCKKEKNWSNNEHKNWLGKMECKVTHTHTQ